MLELQAIDNAALKQRVESARGVMREAGKYALGFFRDRHLAVERKGVQDYVSRVDRETEHLIISALQSAFPLDAFLGEESGRHCEEGAGQYLWVIDPVDGTTNYIHGLPLWCISLALVYEGQIQAGFIFNPVTDEFYEAVQGQGAWCNSQRLNVSAVEKASDARIGLGFSYRRPETLHAEAIRRLLSAHCEYARFGSGALGMAYVADGRFDAYWEPHINAWDVLAGICLVREAGGWCNDFQARQGVLKGNPILACPKALRSFLQETLMSLCEAHDGIPYGD